MRGCDALTDVKPDARRGDPCDSRRAKKREAAIVSEPDRAIARQATLFASLPPDLRDALFSAAHVHAYARAETVFMQDEPADRVFVVLEGWVKLFRVAPTGAEAVVGVFTRGGGFGEAPAFQGGVYPVTAEAVTECRLLEVQASTLMERMRSRPELCLAMIAATFRHLQLLVQQIEQLKGQNGAQRVAEFLISLSPVADGPCAVTLPYDKSLIAGRLGMKPESLSRAFARLREVGVRVQQNKAAILDVARLRELAEEDRAAAWSRSE